MEKEIKEHLLQLEKERNVKVLLAIESGSRAWGFPSPDSDYDVRFFYVQPRENYLSVNRVPDSIDYFHGELLDLKGWDIRKALGLLMKSNASIFEWSQSPIVYQEKGGFLGELSTLCEKYFEPVHVLNHYRGLAKNSFAAFDGKEMKLKKCFYVVRPVLAALWVLDRGTIPPMDMENLYPLIENHPVKAYVENLIEQKKNLGESYVFEPDKLLVDFLNQSFERLDNASLKKVTHKEATLLNDYFRKIIGYE